jgi:hypothetical protein
VDIGQVMPKYSRMGRFFTSMGAALQLAADGRLSAAAVGSHYNPTMGLF